MAVVYRLRIVLSVVVTGLEAACLCPVEGRGLPTKGTATSAHPADLGIAQTTFALSDLPTFIRLDRVDFEVVLPDVLARNTTLAWCAAQA